VQREAAVALLACIGFSHRAELGRALRDLLATI
jgi:hypothetical protein